MGTFVSDSGNPFEKANLKAKGVFTKNDLITLTEAGFGVKSDETLGVGFNNITTQGPSAIYAQATMEGNFYSSSYQQHRNIVELGSGNVAIGYSGNGTTAATQVNVRIRSPLGADVVPRVTVSTDASISGVRLTKISATQFVVSWQATDTLKFAVLNNDGTIAVAATTVSVLNSLGLSVWNVAALVNGEFVFAFRRVTSTNCNFSRYNASGVRQGSETTIEAASNPAYLSVLGCANGDFVVFYCRFAATSAYKFARYNSSGVIVGSLTTIVTTASTLGHGDYSRSTTELSGGNVVFITAGSSDNYPDVHVYNSSSDLVKTIDFGTTTFNSVEIPSVVALDSGGFAVAGRNKSTGTVLATYDVSGNGLLPPTTLTGSVGVDNSATGSGLYCFSLGAAGFAFMRVGYDGTNYDLRLFTCSTLGIATGTPVVLQASGTTVISSLGAVKLSSGAIAFQYYYDSGTVLRFGAYNTLRKSMFGVALNSGVDGETIKLATKGSYTVNQQFFAGGTFDGTSAVVPGNKGIVSGNSVILTGVV